MIKLVAFDWNGTIISDVKAVVAAESAVLKYYGQKPTNLKQFREIYTIPIRNYWTKMGLSAGFFDKNSEEIGRLFLKCYEPKENKCRLRPGVKEILDWLNRKDIKEAIISNHIESHIERQSKRLQVRKYFDKILARPLNDNSQHHKRFKDLLLRDFVKSAKLKPHEVAIVGDTDEEIEIGKNFGYMTIALAGGWQSTARLKAAKPDFLIHNLKELKNIIKKLNK